MEKINNNQNKNEEMFWNAAVCLYTKCMNNNIKPNDSKKVIASVLTQMQHEKLLTLKDFQHYMNLWVNQKFTIESNHPKEEYVKFLEYINISFSEELKQDITKEKEFLILKGMEKISEVLKEISMGQFKYTVMDMLYAGEREIAAQMCSPELLQEYIQLLNNPLGMEKEIYLDFTSHYSMKNQMNTD